MGRSESEDDGSRPLRVLIQYRASKHGYLFRHKIFPNTLYKPGRIYSRRCAFENLTLASRFEASRFWVRRDSLPPDFRRRSQARLECVRGKGESERPQSEVFSRRSTVMKKRLIKIACRCLMAALALAGQHGLSAQQTASTQTSDTPPMQAEGSGNAFTASVRQDQYRIGQRDV